MPIHDLGYRPWEGTYQPRGWRFLVFTKVGIQLALRSRWLKRLVAFAFLQGLSAVVILYAAETFVLSDVQQGHLLAEGVVGIGLSADLWSHQDAAQVLEALDPLNPNRDEDARYFIWRLSLLALMRSPQALLMVLLLGILTPPMISFDIRSRGFLLFFSRPITPDEYIIGKSLIVWAYLLTIIAAPALMAYFAVVCLSPSFTVMTFTWDLPLRILVAAFCVAVPTTALSLCLSALTTESRNARFAWFAIWAIGMAAYGILTAVSASTGVNPAEAAKQWQLLSLYHTLGDVEKLVFGVDRTFGEVLPSLTLLILLTVGCYWVIRRRVMAPMRV